MNRRDLPAVGKLLQAVAETNLPRPLVTRLIRQELAELRAGGKRSGF